MMRFQLAHRMKGCGTSSDGSGSGTGYGGTAVNTMTESPDNSGAVVVPDTSEGGASQELKAVAVYESGDEKHVCASIPWRQRPWAGLSAASGPN